MPIRLVVTDVIMPLISGNVMADWLKALRMLGRDVHSNYGPTADTGGLMRNHAPTIYAYPSLDALFDGETSGGAKAKLPGAAGKTVTERPE